MVLLLVLSSLVSVGGVITMVLLLSRIREAYRLNRGARRWAEEQTREMYCEREQLGKAMRKHQELLTALAAQKAELQRAQQVDEQRQHQGQDAWRRSEKLQRCEKCALILPRYFTSGCPVCATGGSSVPVDAVTLLPQAAFVERFGQGQQPSQPAKQTSLSANAQATSLARPLAPASKTQLSSDFVMTYDQQVQHRNYVGIGNTALQVLLQPPQEEFPDASASHVASSIKAIVAQKYGVPDLLSYECPHSDRFLPAQLRGKWKEDTFPNLLIYAYLLGATWINLPMPYVQLLPYYKAIAKQMEEIIKQAGAAHRQLPMNAIDPYAQNLAALGMSPAAIAAQLRGVNSQRPSGSSSN